MDTCFLCKGASHSYSNKPFEPYNGTIDDETFTCPNCGQRWWQYNDHFHLWSKVDDDTTFKNIQAGCPRPVAIGNVSKNI